MLDLELAAEPASAARSRHAVAEWLGTLCGLAGLCDIGQDLVLAVNEAVSNSVEHAYRDDTVTRAVIELSARVRPVPGANAPTTTRECGRLEVWIEVRDHGCWREPPPDPGFRGRGLLMAEASVDRMGIEHGPDGTVVTLRRALGCPMDDEIVVPA